MYYSPLSCHLTALSPHTPSSAHLQHCQNCIRYKTAGNSKEIYSKKSVSTDTKIQQSYGTTAAQQLRQILNNNHHSTTHKRKLHVLKQIKLKITEGNALISRADKGKSSVIIYTQDYVQKVHSFISDNKFQTIHNDPTTKNHNAIHKALQRCDRIIDKKQIKYLIQKKPNTTHSQ